jgi:hypothetical protein
MRRRQVVGTAAGEQSPSTSLCPRQLEPFPHMGVVGKRLHTAGPKWRSRRLVGTMRGRGAGWICSGQLGGEACEHYSGCCCRWGVWDSLVMGRLWPLAGLLRGFISACVITIPGTGAWLAQCAWAPGVLTWGVSRREP